MDGMTINHIVSIDHGSYDICSMLLRSIPIQLRTFGYIWILPQAASLASFCDDEHRGFPDDSMLRCQSANRSIGIQKARMGDGPIV